MKEKTRPYGNRAAVRLTGFTLIETLVAIGISAILMTRLVPAFDDLIQSMRIKGVTSNIERTLRLARQEAILRQTPTRICPSNNGYSCTAGATWAAGWITYLDKQGGFERDPGDTLVATQPALENVTVVYNRGNLISTSSSGRLSQNGTLRICGNSNARYNIELVMVRSGRLRLQRTSAVC